MMKKLLILLSILAMTSLVQATLVQPFNTDPFTPLGGWGRWASGSGNAGFGSGVTATGGSAGNVRWVPAGGNPGGAVEISVLPSMNFWGRAMAFVHDNPTSSSSLVNITTDVKGAGTSFGIRIEWYAGFNKATPLGTASTLIIGIGPAWTNVSLSAIAPVGANYFTTAFIANSSYMIDNVTPEPMTIALLGLGGLFLQRKNR